MLCITRESDKWRIERESVPPPQASRQQRRRWRRLEASSRWESATYCREHPSQPARSSGIYHWTCPLACPGAKTNQVAVHDWCIATHFTLGVHACVVKEAASSELADVGTWTHVPWPLSPAPVSKRLPAQRGSVTLASYCMWWAAPSLHPRY